MIKGTLREQNRLFLIDPASLATTPRIGDRIALGTHTANASGIVWHEVIKKPELSDVAGSAAMWRVEVSG